ncbi:MAG: hypothetical protein ACRC62_13090 [Microcoleus sp.]
MSPLHDPMTENGSLTILNYLPGTYLDRLGNVQPNSEPIEIDVYLKTESLATATKTEKHPGVDQSAQLLTGYCTNPSIIPFDVRTACWYKCTFGKTDGWFFLKPFGRFGRAGIDDIIEAEIGTKIDGWFQIQRVTM